MTNCNALMVMDGTINYIVTDKIYDHNSFISGIRPFDKSLNYEVAKIDSVTKRNDLIAFTLLFGERIKDNPDKDSLFIYIPSNDTALYNRATENYGTRTAETGIIVSSIILDAEVEVDCFNNLTVKHIYENIINDNIVRIRLMNEAKLSDTLNDLFEM